MTLIERSQYLLCCAIVSVLVAGVGVAELDAFQDSNAGVPDISSRKRGVDWPTFLGPTGDSKSIEKGILTDWTGGNLRLLWQRPLENSYGIGSVSQGRYFQFDRHDDQAKLLCLHAETGKQIWEFKYQSEYVDMYGYAGGPRCSPVVDEDRVYIYGAQGKLFCIDVVTGKEIWKVDTAAKFGVVQNFFGVGSTPVIHGDLLIAMVGGATDETRHVPPGRLNLVKGNGTGIVAFDKKTGVEKYRVTDELASYAAPKLVKRDDRNWCFLFARGGLVGFNPDTGSVDFEFPFRARIMESVNASGPVVVDDTVFISETYGPGSALLKFADKSVEVVWKDDDRKRDKAMQTHWNTPIYHDGYIYGSSGRHTSDAELRCIEHATGKVKWSVPGMGRSSLTLVDGHFVCLAEYGQLFLFRANPEKFELVTQRAGKRNAEGELTPPTPALDYPCWAAPIISHGLMYVRGEKQLLCYELIPEK